MSSTEDEKVDENTDAARVGDGGEKVDGDGLDPKVDPAGGDPAGGDVGGVDYVSRGLWSVIGDGLAAGVHRRLPFLERSIVESGVAVALQVVEVDVNPRAWKTRTLLARALGGLLLTRRLTGAVVAGLSTLAKVRRPNRIRVWNSPQCSGVNVELQWDEIPDGPGRFYRPPVHVNLHLGVGGEEGDGGNGEEEEDLPPAEGLEALRKAVEANLPSGWEISEIVPGGGMPKPNGYDA